MPNVEGQFEKHIRNLQLGAVQAQIHREMLPQRIEQANQERAYFAANQAGPTPTEPSSTQGQTK